MDEYLSILRLILPIFAMLAIGFVLRWKELMGQAVEKGMVELVVKVFYPCLIINSMIEASSFRGSVGSFWGPLAGFGTIVIGFLVCSVVGRVVGIKKGKGLRTFAFSAGIYNYGYLPVPLIVDLYGADELAVLFMHNVGIEIAIWTVGISFLAGGSLGEGLKKIFNPMVVALLVGLALNLSGWNTKLPSEVTSSVSMLAACAVPLGLLAIGANLFDHVRDGEKLWDNRDSVAGIALRLGVLPVVGLAIAWYFPLSIELKRVLVFQAAMPAGIMPIVLTKHYGGQPVVAVRVALATTIVGMLTMPLWIRFGLGLIGG
ncbi:AEC family transporter [Pelagicoccus mobilis]|uniref:AEC family transporter n=1 Tax=Pelagicoccus mobilis TaxID=415221 RepID=A0A934S0G5_9BACT|nr:AEC family transporter [Pelagicoccus mobilis]MBK1879658.1 AEC family transporter [Pelagicoccus mobilis]